MWRDRVTAVWLGLMLLTVITTWGLSKDVFGPAVAVVGTYAHWEFKGGQIVTIKVFEPK